MPKLLFIIPLMIFNIGNWCSCVPLDKIDEKQYLEYNVILKGKVINLTKAQFQKTITVKVETFYKGFQNKTSIKIISPADEGMCGISPQIGETWLIFAYERNERLETHLCTRTKTMNPKAWDYKKEELEDDLKFLEVKRDNSLSHNAP